MVIYFGTFFFFVSAMGVQGMAVAQLLASLVQMIAAIALARREGFFGGVGAGIGRFFAVLAAVTAVGMVLTAHVHLYASLVLLAAAPFAARFIVARLGVFKPEETAQILDLITVRSGRRIAAWMLSADSRGA